MEMILIWHSCHYQFGVLRKKRDGDFAQWFYQLVLFISAFQDHTYYDQTTDAQNVLKFCSAA